jgi:chemotaxis protein methyltransferase CheR
LNTEDFRLFSRVLRERSGLALGEEKTYLLESRLMPLARRRGLDGLGALATALRHPAARDLEREVVEAMTTNESFFFRDGQPFDAFRKVILPRLLEARAARRSIRIWSAACSSGQEPYSLAMILAEESARLAGWRVDIVATDLSTEILDRARAGVYSHFEVQRGLPIQYLAKYFGGEGDRWQIVPEIRRTIDFRTFNLLDDPASLGPFDVVFCRNVLIYFEAPTKTRVLDRIARLMPADGYLVLGGAETVLGVTDRFAPLPGQRGLYGLAPADVAMAV